MNALPATWTAGNGAQGHAGDPGPHQHRPERCADRDHPGVTYNPWHDKTWCLCGEVVRDGNAVEWPKATGCEGPLVDCAHRGDFPMDGPLPEIPGQIALDLEGTA